MAKTSVEVDSGGRWTAVTGESSLMMGAEEALARLARGLTNKLLHAPSVQLKKLSAEGRVEALGVVQELFALGDGTDNR